MNLCETVTHHLLDQMATGMVPWRRTWQHGLPKSLATGKELRGINLLLLGGTGFTSRYWLTSRQAQRLGGQIRNDERATPVICWKSRPAENLHRFKEATGSEGLAPGKPFLGAVFNLEQAAGVPAPADDRDRHPDRLHIASQMLDVLPDQPQIDHSRIAAPSYSPRLDRITLPHLSQFESADDHFWMVFRARVRSSGHPRRLNPCAAADGDRVENCPFEELVAEFGAAFLCGFAGIEHHSREAVLASEVDRWARAFRQDGRMLVRAADYLRGKLLAEATQSAAQPERVSLSA